MRKAWLLNLLLCAVYFVTARLGLEMGAVSGFATLIWPPSGIALAALLLLGQWLWPGVFLGALFVNWSVGASLPAALGIAVGNTLEPLVGALLLSRFGFSLGLKNVRSVFLLLAVGMASPLLSATMGVLSLYGSGRLVSSTLGPTGWAWWLGDVMGILMVAPLFLVWSEELKTLGRPRRVLEGIGLSALVVILSVVNFGTWFFPAASSGFPRPYLIFPVVLVVALRLGQPGVVSNLFLISATVVTSIALGHGRFFYEGSLSGNLMEAQIFLGILASTHLFLAAALSELQSQEAELQQAIGARDEFISIASHELRTPLTSLSLRLQLVERALKQGDSAKALSMGDIRQTVAICLNHTRKLAELLDELLDLSRIRLGRLRLDRKELDLVALCRDVLSHLREGFPQARINLTAQPETILGQWDLFRLEQVVTNLITNAIKYGEKSPISVSISQAGSRALIEVTDGGMGIPAEMHSKIFERFERGSGASRISGLGLGLYITRQIIEAHDGQITVESELGRGSTFRVELPLVRA